MRGNVKAIIGIGAWFACCLAVVCPAQASYLSVDAFSLTLAAQRMTPSNIDLPQMNRSQGMTVMPFYLQLNFLANQNLNWGIELYSDNRQVLGQTLTTADGVYRGLRGRINVDEKVPLFWQVYATDLGVAPTLGTPNSLTLVAGSLAFSESTLRYWAPLVDRADVDHQPQALWDTERPGRIVANVNGLGNYPNTGRFTQSANVFLYFAADLRLVGITQEYIGQLVIDFFHYPFDFNTGCYVTPNPVKPVRGQRAYFNFFTNYPDSKVRIKIYDPTGYPVVTVEDSRYWDCRNASGNWVEGGLYLYQIEVEGHLISGTVVVIK